MQRHVGAPGLQPIPKHDSFAHAHEAISDSFGETGAWDDVVYRHAELPHDATLRRQFLGAFTLGNLIRQSELENDQDSKWELPHYLIGRAFVQGFFQQLEPSQLLYSNRFSMDNALKILHYNYSQQQKNFQKITDEEERRVFESQYIIQLGSYGLHVSGEVARAHVNDWSEQAYLLDTRLQRSFRLGHGVMIMCGVNYQTLVNDQLLDDPDIIASLDEEMNMLLLSDSAEEK